jgi:hypothetical protein
MHSKTLIDEVDRLLREGELSQRKIAERLGVSRGTVGAIASGQRGLFGREPGDGVGTVLMPAGPAERCAGCGYRVYLPCLVCRTRAHRSRNKFVRQLEPTAEQATALQ